MADSIERCVRDMREAARVEGPTGMRDTLLTVAGQPAEPSPAGDYLDGVNIPELTRALVWLGVATGGQEEMAARLSWYVNQIVSAVLRHKELWSAPKGDSNG